MKLLFLVFLNMITAQYQGLPLTGPQQGRSYAQAPAQTYAFPPQIYSTSAPVAQQSFVGASARVAPPAAAVVQTTASAVAPKKAPPAADEEKQRKAKEEAQQGIIDARIVDRARDIDVFGADNLRNGILTNPLFRDVTTGTEAFNIPTNAKIIQAGSTFTRVMSRRRVANQFQRQIDRYKEAHPEPSTTDYHTVFQLRAKRDENNAVGDSFRTSVVSTFVPPAKTGLAKGLSAVGSALVTKATGFGSVAANHAYALAKDKFLKNTSDVTNRQVFFQAADFKEAENLERKGAEADRLNAVLPLIGAAKSNPYLAQYGVLSTEKGLLREKNIALRQLKIAKQKYEDDPSEDNWLKVKLARATFDWRDQFEQFHRSKSFNTLAKSKLPILASNIFAASQILRYKDRIDAQKRISRITLEIRKRDYAKKFGGATDETQQRMLALSSYGGQSQRNLLMSERN